MEEQIGDKICHRIATLGGGEQRHTHGRRDTIRELVSLFTFDDYSTQPEFLPGGPATRTLLWILWKISICPSGR